MSRIFTQGRYATVTSTLALALALGGTAYAINTVDTFDIVNDTVQSVDIKNNSLSTVDIFDGTVASADIADGTIASADIATGAIQTQDFAPATVSPPTFAVIRADGTVFSHDRVAGVTHPATGVYQVTFQSSVNVCAWLATPGSRDGDQDSANRSITLNRVSPTEILAVTGINGAPVDMDFNLAVLC